MALRNLLVRIGADLSGLTKGMDNATKQLNKFSANVGSTMGGLQTRVMGAMGALGGGLFVKGGVEDAIRYEALMGTLGQSMGESVQDFKTWQNEVGSAMGFSKLAGADLANTLSLNFKKIAVDQKDLVGKTTKMMEMAAIVANKRGMSMTEVSDRIRSAMNQEADGADELGVNVRVAAIEASNAYKEMGASGPWDKLSEHMRKSILYSHILEQVSQNLGTTLSDNTQIRLAGFKAALDDTRMALGQAFLPIIYTVLPYLTALMRYLERAMQYIAAFMRSLFNIDGNFGPAISGLDDMTASTGGAIGGLEGIGEAAEEAGEKAKKAAEKAGEGLQSFDQVHLLAEKTASAGGGGGKDDGGGGVSVPGPPPLPMNPPKDSPIYDKISDEIDKLTRKIRKFFEESEGWKTMKKGAMELWESLKDIANSDALKWLGQQIGEDLPDFFDDLMLIGGGALEVIAGGLDLIVSLLNNDMQKGWEGWGEIIAGVYDIFAGTVGLIFPDLGNKLDKFGDDFDRLWGWIDETFISTSDTWTEAWEKFSNFLQEKGIDKLEEFKDTAKDTFQNFKLDMITNLFETLKTWDQKWKDSKKAVKDAFDFLTGKSDISMGEFRAAVARESKKAWEEFKKPFMPAYNWFNENLIKPIKRGLEGFGKGFDVSFGEGLKSLYNDIALRINGLLGGLSQINIGDKYPLSFITRYALPRLAKGGITSGPTLALVGDNPGGQEAIAPLDKLQGFITNAVLAAVGGGGTSGGDIVLNIDGRQFARIVKPHLDKEVKRVGANVKLNPI